MVLINDRNRNFRFGFQSTLPQFQNKYIPINRLQETRSQMQSHLISSIPYELQNFSYFHNTSHLIINLFFLSSHILKAPLLLLLLFLLFSCSPVLLS